MFEQPEYMIRFDEWCDQISDRALVTFSASLYFVVTLISYGLESWL